MFRTREDLLYQSLYLFFTQRGGTHIRRILPILNGKSSLSLRFMFVKVRKNRLPHLI